MKLKKKNTIPDRTTRLRKLAEQHLAAKEQEREAKAAQDSIKEELLAVLYNGEAPKASVEVSVGTHQIRSSYVAAGYALDAEKLKAALPSKVADAVLKKVITYTVDEDALIRAAESDRTRKVEKAIRAAKFEKGGNYVRLSIEPLV